MRAVRRGTQKNNYNACGQQGHFIQGNFMIEKMKNEQLVTLAQSGEDLAIEELVVRNERIVYSIVNKMRHTLDQEDLVQVGFVAVLEAIKRFDHKKGNMFTTFAHSWVFREVKKYIDNNQRNIRLPKKVQDDARRVREVEDKLSEEREEDVKVKHVSGASGVSVQKINLIKRAQGAMLSLDQSITEETSRGETLHQVIPDQKESFEDGFVNGEFLKEVLNILENDEREVIHRRFIKEEKQSEIAEKMNVSQGYVSRLEKRSLKKLKLISGDVL